MTGRAGRFFRQPLLLAGAVVWLACLILYSVTLAPDVLAHDSGEWQAAAATLGISHAPGSPAYLLLAHIFTWAPLGTVAARVSFLSAVVGASGVTALFIFMRMLLGRWLPAVVAAVSLALAALWWSHASVATPYNMVPALIAVFLILLLDWHRRDSVRSVGAGFFLAGIGLAYHPTLLYFIPVLVAGLFMLGPWRKLLKPRAAVTTLLLLVAGLSFFIYLPVRSAADPAVKNGSIDSLGSFIEYVSAAEVRDTGHGQLAVPEPARIREQFVRVVRDGYHPLYAFLVLGPAVMLFYPPVLSQLGRQRRFLLFLAAALAGHLLVIFMFSSIYAQYFMPLLLYFSIWAGFSVYLLMLGCDLLEIKRLAWVPAVIIAAIYLGFLGAGLPRVWPFVDHGNDVAMREYIGTVYRQAGPGAVVLANWETYTGLQYAMAVDGMGEGVILNGVPQYGWADELPLIRSAGPPRILLSHTSPFDDRDGAEVERRIAHSQLSIKGRTYQDRLHGEPYPAIIQLFVLKTGAGSP